MWLRLCGLLNPPACDTHGLAFNHTPERRSGENPSFIRQNLMVPVYRPENGMQLALAESALAAHGIPYFVHNRGMGSLYPGPQIDHYNNRTVMVPPSAAGDAQEILSEYLGPADEVEPEADGAPRHPTREKVRLVLEALMFTWFVPRSKWKSWVP